jgi:chemotaxis methyl-accepting protein methylase
MSSIITSSSELPQPGNAIQEDMAKLKSLLQESLLPHLAAGQKDMRILNLACGRCDEAETLIQVGSDLAKGGSVEMVGADIRIREIRQARETHSHLPAEFLIEDATKIDQHKELGDDFNMVFLRHQNFWHGQELWKKIFDQGIAKLRPDGMLVITSYFDVEHRLALRALEALGMEVVSNKRNKASRALKDAPGKSVDRWVAVLRRRQA